MRCGWPNGIDVRHPWQQLKLDIAVRHAQATGRFQHIPHQIHENSRTLVTPCADTESARPKPAQILAGHLWRKLAGIFDQLLKQARKPHLAVDHPRWPQMQQRLLKIGTQFTVGFRTRMRRVRGWVKRNW